MCKRSLHYPTISSTCGRESEQKIMPKRKTIEEFRQEIFELGNGEYTLLSDEYVNNKTKVRLRHEPCGFEYDIKPNYFINGNRCPFCARKVHKDTNYFKNEVFNLVGNEYEVLDKYTNTHSKITFKHNCGNIFKMSPHNFLGGQRCPKCQHRSYAKTTEEFKQELFDLVGDEYELISDYINTKTKVTLKHKVCGRSYSPNPTDFLYGGYRCFHCYGNIKKTQTEFEHEVFEQRGSEYSVIGTYKNMATKIKMRHNTCGWEWDVLPRDFIGKHSGCPKCNQSKGEIRIENYLIGNNFNYEPQKTYLGLVGLGNGLLSYDFYLPEENLLIEYQGHFHDGIANDYVAQNLDYRKEHDRRKRQYAIDHNIKLLEIWYWDFDKIEDILESHLI